MKIAPGEIKRSTLYRSFTVLAAVAIIALLLGSWVIITNREAQQAAIQRDVNTSAGKQLPPNMYVLTYNTSTLLRLNTQNGNTIWKQKPGANFQALTYANNIVYAGAESELDAFNAQSGTRLWHVPVKQMMPSFAPQVSNGLVYTTDGDYITALDARSGAKRWTSQFKVLDLALYQDVIEEPPFEVIGTMLYSVDLNNNFYAINALTGRILWHHYFDSSIIESIDQANGIAYVVHGNVLSALDAKSGNLLWQQIVAATQTLWSLSLADGIVYADSSASNKARSPVPGGYVYAFDAQSGKQLWISPPGYNLAWPGMSVSNGIVLATYTGTGARTDIGNLAGLDTMSNLAGLDTRTGKQIWQACNGNCSTHLARVVNGIAYVNKFKAVGNPLSDKLLVLDIKTGRELAQYAMNSVTDVRVINNTLYSFEVLGPDRTKTVTYVIQAFNLADGKQLWSHTFDSNKGGDPSQLASAQLIVTH